MERSPTLSPEMLLFEVAALCSRHGLAVSTANPSAALHHAAHLLRALGLTPDEPAALPAGPPRVHDATATAQLPLVPMPPRRGVHRVQRPFALVPPGGAS